MMWKEYRTGSWYAFQFLPSHSLAKWLWACYGASVSSELDLWNPDVDRGAPGMPEGKGEQ